MAREQRSYVCQTCGKQTLHVKTEPQTTGCAGHVLLTIISCGLWIPIAMMVYGVEVWAGLLAPWHCQVCGRKK